VSKGLVVVAIGGNSLIKDRMHQSVRDQFAAARQTCEHIASMVHEGWDVVIGHGNGPQVGFILRRSELAAHELHQLPLDVCDADSQGAIGYALAQNLQNELRRYDVNKPVVAVVTQVEVDCHDPAFAAPSKPIGTFMDEAEAARHHEADGWDVAPDANRGWRRVVASPRPHRIVELDVIRTLVAAGAVVIGVGGGGIPVVSDERGDLHGVEAVIDKDLACSLLASDLGADLFLITTGVDRVALHFGTPDEEWLDRLTLADAKKHLAEGTHFARGSMAPKIEAVVGFLERGGAEAVITSPDNIERALRGDAGTRITAA
jgi:carbamate kinase